MTLDELRAPFPVEYVKKSPALAVVQLIGSTYEEYLERRANADLKLGTPPPPYIFQKDKQHDPR